MCETCQGRRFTEEVLAYRLRGKNISEVLAMSVEEAQAFFTEKPIKVMLDRLADVGLGYITLGQMLNTLSGGRAPAAEAGDRDEWRRGGLRPR